MADREQYTPGPASGARIQRDGEKWTLILVRELRHSPETVWDALPDPAQLRAWARLGGGAERLPSVRRRLCQLSDENEGPLLSVPLYPRPAGWTRCVLLAISHSSSPRG